jgi:SAM-dependent methyltransferase
MLTPGKKQTFADWVGLLIARECPAVGLSVDIGCGTAETHKHFKNSVIGVDSGSAARPTVLAVAEALPFRSESFDFCTSFQCYYYVHDIEEALNELHRILLPDSVILISLSNYRSLKREAKTRPGLPVIRKSGQWVSLFRSHGFTVENVVMPRRYSGAAGALLSGLMRALTPYDFYKLTKIGATTTSLDQENR